MIRSRSLFCLQRNFDERLMRLDRIVSETNIQDPSFDRRIAYAIIECINAWSVFAREYYLSCSLISAKTINGIPVTSTIQRFSSERDAILYSIQHLKPTLYARASASSSISPRDEPTWHETRTLIVISNQLGWNNLATISSSFSYPTTFFEHCPTVRNFFAHRNKETAAKVVRLASRPPYSATVKSAAEFVGVRLPGRGQTLIEEWIEDLRLVSHGICL